MNSLARSTISPQTLVEKWNKTFQVGTNVRYWKGARDGCGMLSRTTTPAQVLGGHTPVVWLEGESACIALSHVEPAPPPVSSSTVIPERRDYPGREFFHKHNPNIRKSELNWGDKKMSAETAFNTWWVQAHQSWTAADGEMTRDVARKAFLAAWAFRLDEDKPLADAFEAQAVTIKAKFIRKSHGWSHVAVEHNGERYDFVVPTDCVQQ